MRPTSFEVSSMTDQLWLVSGVKPAFAARIDPTVVWLMTWVYQRFAGSTSPLYLLKDAAQRSHKGLWGDRSPVPPWRWRKEKR